MTTSLTYNPPAVVASVSPSDLGCGQFRTKFDLEVPAIQPFAARPSVTQSGVNAAQSIIEAIGNLDVGWDGYDSRPISYEVCMNAQAFLAAGTIHLPTPEITPTSNGTMNFEWTSNDAEAYLEIGRTRYSGHIEPKYGETIYLSGTLTEPVVQDSGVQQALALISGFLHVTSSAPSLAQGIRITEPTF